MEQFNGIDQEKLDFILNRIKDIRIATIGDICLDVYWKADMTKSELSRETPHFPLPIIEERMYPGAGGNVAVNCAALLPKSIKAFGVTGRDWRGEILIQKLKETGIDTGGIVVSEKAVTNAYCKPIRKGISHLEVEDPRLDFNNHEKLPQEDEARICELLSNSAGEIDILCVSDQLLYGCITPIVREKILFLSKNGLKVVVDSRDRISLYPGTIMKPNEVEGMRAVNTNTGSLEMTLENYIKAAEALSQQNKSEVCMTLGAKGCVYTDAATTVYIPSYEVQSPIDICGAGDTFLSAFSCAIAAGARPFEAASFANMAADVTIKKIGVTGTASPDEIRERQKQIFLNPRRKRKDAEGIDVNES
jgi:rfaE bifunctional protein kinase chain/domain